MTNPVGRARYHARFRLTHGGAVDRFDLTPPDDAQRARLEAALSPDERHVLLQH